MHRIDFVKARQILDSRGNPTIEVEVGSGRFRAIGSAPSGASTGSREALELRDHGKEFLGRSVRKAVDNVNREIAPRLKGMDPTEQREIDQAMIELDGTPNKSRLGANAIVACSMACSRLGAICRGMELYEHLADTYGFEPRLLPIPAMNLINGGKHAGNDLDIQEHMIFPIGAKSFSDALRYGVEIYHVLKEKIISKYGKSAVNVGDEGGYAPPLKDTREALDLLTKAIEEMGYEKEVKLALDSAATELFDGKNYRLGGKLYSSDELIDFYKEMIETYEIVSIEDPFAEDDWKGFVEFTKCFGNKIQIVGDDLFVTNAYRLREGIERGACNAILLKVNQVGTVSEAIDTAKLAFENGYKVMVSHRSGETCDDFIADLSVAINSGQIKTGAPARGERVSKYNRLLKIEEKRTFGYGVGVGDIDPT